MVSFSFKTHLCGLFPMHISIKENNNFCLVISCNIILKNALFFRFVHRHFTSTELKTPVTFKNLKLFIRNNGNSLSDSITRAVVTVAYPVLKPRSKSLIQKCNGLYEYNYLVILFYIRKENNYLIKQRSEPINSENHRAELTNDLCTTCWWSGRIHDKTDYSRAEFALNLFITWYFLARIHHKKGMLGRVYMRPKKKN